MGCRLKPLLDCLAATTVADCSAFHAKGFCLLWISSYGETSWLFLLQWEGLHTIGGSCEMVANLSKPDPSPSHTSSKTEAICPTHQLQKLFSSNHVRKALKNAHLLPHPIRLRSRRAASERNIPVLRTTKLLFPRCVVILPFNFCFFLHNYGRSPRKLGLEKG